MATIDLGKIKQVWRGTYSSSNSYTVDDLVAYTDTVGGLQNTSTYIAVAASSSSNQQAPASGGTVNSSYWALVAQGVPDRIPSQSGHADKVLKTNGSALSWGQGSKILQIKDYINTTRGTPNGTGTYLNYGSFQKLGGTETDLYMLGTFHMHDGYGNNVGAPSIRWNGNTCYTGFDRVYYDGSYQQGVTWQCTFASKAAATADITYFCDSDNHRWSSVINPNNSDGGVSNRYNNTIGSTCRVIEYIR